MGGLIGSMIACFFMGIVYEGLKFWREHLMRGNFRRVSSLLFSGFMFLSEDFAYLSLVKRLCLVNFITFHSFLSALTPNNAKGNITLQNTSKHNSKLKSKIT